MSMRSIFTVQAWSALKSWVWVLGVWLFAAQASATVQYMTRSEDVKWQHEGSKFFCRLSHEVEGFGLAVFEREAGEQTRFELNSQSPRMKTGKAALVSRHPAWSSQNGANTLAIIRVRESMEPINLGRKLAERMLAEQAKGPKETVVPSE